MKRRQFVLGSAGLLAWGSSMIPAPSVSNERVRVVIAGAGAAGLTIASQLRRRLPHATITIFDARKHHYFQPGYTLVGAGWWSPSEVIDTTREYIPRDVNWVEQQIAEFDPDAKTVVTNTGVKHAYDWLFVATGLVLDYTAIQGMHPSLIGQQGIASIYAGPEAAAASARTIDRFIESGGVGLFGRPTTEMKCAGAPLKMTFITDDKARRAGRRSSVKLHYMAHNQALFGVAPVNEKVKQLFHERDISTHYGYVLSAIDPGSRRATFLTANGMVSLDYDLIHVIPPMRAPAAVRNSPLAWKQGPMAADGWIEVDPATLRSKRYPEVFAVGDVAGVPRGKTAASVKWQAPVAVDHMVAAVQGKTSPKLYNGYTSCPMVTKLGAAMLIEFDYEGKLVQSFPFIDPLKELWVSWMIEEKVLRGTYRAMLRGYA